MALLRLTQVSIVKAPNIMAQITTIIPRIMKESTNQKPSSEKHDTNYVFNPIFKLKTMIVIKTSM